MVQGLLFVHPLLGVTNQKPFQKVLKLRTKELRAMILYGLYFPRSLITIACFKRRSAGCQLVCKDSDRPHVN